LTKRLKVLLLPPPPRMKDPWQRDIVAAVGSRHELNIYDKDAASPPQFEGIDAVIDFGGSMGTREMADVASSVRLWQIHGTGIDHFDLEYWRQKDIPVANCPGEYTGIPLAESALMFMIMLARRWYETQDNLRQGILYVPLGSELANKCLGLVGFGASARELARRAKAFAMRISAIDIRDVSEEDQQEFGLEFVGKPRDLDRVIQESDFLSLHLHLNDETRHIIDARRLRLMKPTSYVINVARGALVDEQALYSALAGGRLAGAGLDVFSTEPMDPDHPLLKLPNVVATPHIAGTTDGTSQRRAAFAAKNIDRIADGLEPLHRLDSRLDASVPR
jgi:phosphoglycerate dehydrogenase-like enzyme